MNFISARQIFHDAFMCDYGRQLDLAGGGGASARTPGSNNKRIVNGCEMGKAQAIIAKLPKLPRSWGMWCYTEVFTQQDHDRVRQSFFAEYESLHGDDFHGDFLRTCRTITLLNFACEDMKSRVTKGIGTPRGELYSLLGVGKNNIKRDGWLHRLDVMERMIDEVDRDALIPLAELLKRPEAVAS